MNEANKEWLKEWLEGLLKRTWLPVLVAATLLVGFSILLIWFGPKQPPNDKVWDWWIGVVGTLFSLIVGLAGAAAHLRARRKAHLRHLLRVELNNLYKTLKGSNDNTQPTSTYIHPLVIEEAVMSGLFEPKLSAKMLMLLKVYQKYAAHRHSSSGAEKDLTCELKKCIRNILEDLR